MFLFFAVCARTLFTDLVAAVPLSPGSHQLSSDRLAAPGRAGRLALNRPDPEPALRTASVSRKSRDSCRASALWPRYQGGGEISEFRKPGGAGLYNNIHGTGRFSHWTGVGRSCCLSQACQFSCSHISCTMRADQ
jgi:hypothetical protein